MKPLVQIFLLLTIPLFLIGNDYPHLKVELIQDSLLKNANAVIRFYDNEVRILSDDKMEVVESVAITVLNEKAAGFLDFQKSYTEGSTKLTDIKLIYLDGDGNEIYKPKKKDFSDLNAYSNVSIASSQKFKYFDYTPTSYPITIVYSLKTKTSNTCFIPNWIPLEIKRVSLEKSSFKIINDTQIQLNFYENNFEEFNVQKVSDFSYLIENVKPLKVEKYMPPLRSLVPSLYLSLNNFNYEGFKGTANNWTSYGQWLYSTFLKDRDSFDKEELKIEILKNCSSNPSKKEIARAVYKYVQDNTRYVSIQFNEGGFKPMSPAKVDEYKYGDCKGLSYYTIALLDLFDIKSNYVLVHAGSEDKRSLKKDFFNHQQANHAILNIPFEDEVVWLDATSSVSPFNFLGSFTDDRFVLSVNENEAEILRTPDYGSDLNFDKVFADLVLNDSGQLSGNYSREYAGLQYSYIKYKSKKEKKEIKKIYTNNEFEDFDSPEISNVSFSFDDEKIIARESLDLSIKEYGEKLGDYLLIPIQFVELEIPKLKKTKNRKYSINFLRGQRQISQVIINLPKNSGYKIKSNSVNYTSDFGEYNCEYSLENDVLEIIRTFEIFKGTLPNTKYNEIRLFFNKIRKHEKSALNLENRT